MALDCDGTNYAYNDSWLGISALPLTIAGWINPDTLTGNRAVCSIGRNNTTGEMLALLLYGGGGSALSANSQSGGSSASGTTTGITVSVWNHVAGVWASTTSRTAYINGTPGTADTTSISVPSASGQRATMGATTESSPGSICDGKVAYLGVWSAALTDAEIAALARGLHPRCVRPASLRVVYGMDRDDIVTGTSVRDLGSNGYPLTITASLAFSAVQPGILMPQGLVI